MPDKLPRFRTDGAIGGDRWVEFQLRIGGGRSAVRELDVRGYWQTLDGVCLGTLLGTFQTAHNYDEWSELLASHIDDQGHD